MAGTSHIRASARFARWPVRLAAVCALTLAGACSNTPTTPTPTTPPIVVTPPAVNNPPTVACPAPMSVTSPTNGPTSVTYATPTAEGGQAAVTVACTPASGTTFPIGTTSVQCVAKDALDRTGSCAFPVTVAPPAQLRRVRFMAFGDSITAGEVTVPVTGITPVGQAPSFTLIQVLSAAYPTVLSRMLSSRYVSQSASLVVFNEGKGGEAAASALSRFISTFNSERPDVVLLMEGYNDICCGNGSVGISSGISGLGAVASEARNRGARVFIATLAPSKPGFRAAPLETVQAYNSLVRSLAAREGAYLVDVYGALLPDVNANIGIDGLHPTEIGYGKMAEAFFAAIQADLEVRP